MNVAIDLDGTLAEWPKGPMLPYGVKAGVGEWIDGAEAALRELLRDGHRVVVHSCRTTWEDGGGTEAVLAFVGAGVWGRGRDGWERPFLPVPIVGQEMAVPVETAFGRAWHLADIRPERGQVGVWVGVGKPIAHWYVDDRGLHFDGRWLGDGGMLEVLRALAQKEG